MVWKGCVVGREGGWGDGVDWDCTVAASLCTPAVQHRKVSHTRQPDCSCFWCPCFIGAAQARLCNLKQSEHRAQAQARLTELERRLQLDKEEMAEWEAT